MHSFHRLFLAAIITSSFSTITLAGTNQVVGYYKNQDDRVFYDFHQNFDDVASPEKEGWRDYTVALLIHKNYKAQDGSNQSWSDKILVHFTSMDDARSFEKVMRSSRATDIYFNFTDSSYNHESDMDSCATSLLGLNCLTPSTRVINYRQIDARKAFAYEKEKNRNIPLLDYISRP